MLSSTKFTLKPYIQRRCKQANNKITTFSLFTVLRWVSLVAVLTQWVQGLGCEMDTPGSKLRLATPSRDWGGSRCGRRPMAPSLLLLHLWSRRRSTRAAPLSLDLFFFSFWLGSQSIMLTSLTLKGPHNSEEHILGLREDSTQIGTHRGGTLPWAL